MLKKDLIKEVDRLKKELARRERISSMDCRRLMKLADLTRDVRNAMTKYYEDNSSDE